MFILNNFIWKDKDILKRFCKDYSLPINVYDPELIEYYINLYDYILQTKSKYELLKTTLAEFDNDKDAFLSYSHQLSEKIINSVEQTEGYNKFITCNMDEYMSIHNEVEGIKYVKSVNLYNPDNSGKYFVSIDMRKANFQALWYFDSNIVFGTNSYDDFISLFTDKAYFKESKEIRQTVFGKLTNGRLQRQERSIMEKVLKFILHYGYPINIPVSAVKVFTTDEIILEGRIEELTPLDLAHEIFVNTGIRTKVEPFKLEYLGNNAYVKVHNNAPPTFKGCSSVYFPQMYKTYMGLPLQEEDLYFMYEKKLAKFTEPLKWEINE